MEEDKTEYSLFLLCYQPTGRVDHKFRDLTHFLNKGINEHWKQAEAKLAHSSWTPAL